MMHSSAARHQPEWGSLATGMKRVLTSLAVVAAIAATPLLAPPPAVAFGVATAECEDPLTRSDIGGQYVGSDTDDAHDSHEAPTGDVAGDIAVGPRGSASSAPDTPEPTTAPPTTEPAPACDFVYEMEYPVVGGGTFGSGFGAPRDGGARRHMGVDLMAPKMTPVVAVADGTVNWIRQEAGRCCYLSIEHDDGWESWYIHLNNDRYGTDDGQGKGVRTDLRVGDRVMAGEVIGWIGDSGNAETTPPHLHFELHMPNGEPIDPVPSTDAARARSAVAQATIPDTSLTELAAALTQTNEGFTFAAPEGVSVQARLEPGLARPDFVGPFLDDDGLASESAFAALTASGVQLWCDDWGVRVCPGEITDGATAESWIGATFRGDRDPSSAIRYLVRQGDPGLNRQSAAGCGVSQLCADAPVTYGEAAAMILGVRDGSSISTPTEAADVLAMELGCGPTSAAAPMTRGELATILAQLSGHAQSACQPVS